MDTSVKLAEVFGEYRSEIDSLKGLLDACPIPMFVTNGSGEIIHVNSAYLNLLDAKLQDVVKNGWLNFIHPEDRARVEETWEKLFNLQGIDREDLEARYVKMDGHVITATTRICRIFHNQFSGFIVQPK